MMKESELYIKFVQRNLLWLLTPMFLVLIISIYFYAQVPTRTKISQTFKLVYKIENIDTLLALTDQLVAQMRAQRFANLYPESSVAIFKSAPLNISIEATSLNRDTSYALLLKESEYLRQNSEVEELTTPEIILIEPSLLKYLLSGLIIGGLIGLAASLIREYLKKY
jgi:hypothetical protein